MKHFLFIVALLGSLAGAYHLWETFTLATSAPQQAAGAGIAVALAVVPYVFARSVQLVLDAKERAEFNERVLDRIDSLERAVVRKAKAAE